MRWPSFFANRPLTGGQITSCPSSTDCPAHFELFWSCWGYHILYEDSVLYSIITPFFSFTVDVPSQRIDGECALRSLDHYMSTPRGSSTIIHNSSVNHARSCTLTRLLHRLWCMGYTPPPASATAGRGHSHYYYSIVHESK